MKEDITFLFRTNKELKEKAMKIAKRNNINLSSLLNAYMLDTVNRDMIPINIRSKIRTFENKDVTIPEIKKALDQIINRSYKKTVYKASIFGSYARGEQKSDSDIDIALTTDRDHFSLLDLADINKELENTLGKEIDLIIVGGLRPEILKEIERDEICIYEACRHK